MPEQTTPAAPTVTRAEIANAAVIAVSGLLIAYSSYQSSLWSGEEELNFSRANILYTQAARTWDRANVVRATDIELFSHWLDATLHKESQVAEFYASRTPPELREPFKAWLDLDPMRNSATPFSPLGMPQYAPADERQAKALEDQGVSAFEAGRRAKHFSESYEQAVTIFSTALFFAGIGQVFRARVTQNALLGLSVFASLLGIVRLLTLPFMSLFAS
jgi:hypothetical protein